MTDNLVIGRVPVGSIIAGLVLLAAATVGWLIFSAIVDAFPRWVDKALLLILGGTVIYASFTDGQKDKRIAELEQKLNAALSKR
jgi:putative Mn2+ efflux pump MntP